MGIPHAKHSQVVSLNPYGAAINEAKTKALVKENDFEAIRLVIRAGEEIPPHQVEGPITVYCIEGRIVFTAESKTMQMETGDWLYLLGSEVHSLKGIEDSSLLVTIIFRKDEAR